MRCSAVGRDSDTQPRRRLSWAKDANSEPNITVWLPTEAHKSIKLFENRAVKLMIYCLPIILNASLGSGNQHMPV